MCNCSNNKYKNNSNAKSKIVSKWTFMKFDNVSIKYLIKQLHNLITSVQFYNSYCL